MSPPQSQIAYEERITSNITTLTTTNAERTDGVIQGLLYVPEIADPACNSQQYDFIPRNVTRREQLPPIAYNLIAIAPWFSIDCTLAYLDSARLDPLRGFIFYKPNNSSNKPQDGDSPVWNLEDNGAWKKRNKYPIFAISGMEGKKIMKQLSRYSGDIDEIPHGDEINDLYGPNPKDYVRVWTELTLEDDSSIPELWVFFLIIIGALVLVITGVSGTMHLIQRRRRKSLKRRVESGEVDLEAMGIKRLTVSSPHVKGFPLFTYNADPEGLNPPSTPSSTGPLSPRSNRPSRNSRRLDQRSVVSTNSFRSKRTSIGATGDATATNFQPNCHICLIGFEHRVTIIRELPCGHIFHPVCIDEFLAQNSSLCPMCKRCMLPRGYSPRITNGMVRRERAVRRLRERVDFDSLSIESGDTKMKVWGRRLFRSASTAPSPPSDIPMGSIHPPKTRRSAPEGAISIDEEQPDTPNDNAVISDAQSQTTPPQAPAPVRTSQSRRTRPRALNILPSQPEESEPAITPTAGRGSPSSFARERMRQIAAKNAPFDDPDQQRAACKFSRRYTFVDITNSIQGGVQFQRFSRDSHNISGNAKEHHGIFDGHPVLQSMALALLVPWGH